MESTWASGAIELLSHADAHIDLKTAFDKRIAYISIDNSVETMIRSYLSLPRSKSGIKVSRKKLEEAGNSFPTLLGLLYSNATDKLVGIDAADVEHYHRIRNTLYHEGTGLSVDDQYLMAYRGIAGVLMQNLFGSSVGPSNSEPDTLERLIVNWNNIEQTIRERTEAKGMFATQLWEKAVAAGLSDDRDLQLLDDLRKARNRLVHSSSIDKEELAHWINTSGALLEKLSESTQATETELPADVALTYKKISIDQDLHRYSLVVSVTLNKTPDQEFFRLVIFWPLDVKSLRARGFKQSEEQKIIEGRRYLELPLDVQERLWPGQTMKVVGGSTGAQIEYSVDDDTFQRLHKYSAEVHYALYFQDWHPVRGKVPFKELNEF